MGQMGPLPGPWPGSAQACLPCGQWAQDHSPSALGLAGVPGFSPAPQLSPHQPSNPKAGRPSRLTWKSIQVEGVARGRHSFQRLSPQRTRVQTTTQGPDGKGQQNEELSF